MNKFRLYIDEVGSSSKKTNIHPNERYLSLTGVIVNLSYINQTLFNELEQLKKKYFESHPDNPIIFHRKELVNKKYPFHALRNPTIEKRFNTELLSYLEKWNYSVITVVIDKIEHKNRYTIWQYETYHYCMAILLERFILYLKNIESTGDVMAESRGGKEDMRLKKSFINLWTNGTEHISKDIFQEFLTSKELKVKSKSNNISGLQLCDLIAHPSRRAILRSKGKIQNDTNVFGDKIEEILQSKYYKNSTGKIWGYGKKLLP